MKKIIIIFLMYSNTVIGQSVFESFLLNENLKPAQVSMVVYNSTKNEMVETHQNEKLLYPASLQKLVTTSSALDILGPDFKYTTKVNLKGTLNSGLFKGVIEIESSGDPTTNAKLTEFIYDFLKDQDINKIEGYILVNQEKFDLNVEKSWLIEDVANYYGSPAYGFNFMDNTYWLSLQQKALGEKPDVLSTTPLAENLVFNNQLVSKGNSDNAYIIGLPYSKERVLLGSIPAGENVFTIKGAVDKPEEVFKSLLLKKLKSKKLDFFYNDNISNMELLASKDYFSEKLIEIVSTTNQKSNNLYAEALLKTIGLEKYGFGSTENGLRAIETINPKLNSKLYDGSGLSRKNLMSADYLISFLNKKVNDTNFRNSLGVSGVSGTMKYFSSEKIKGQIQGKSGSADGILNYAGYFKNEKGEQMVFVIFVNNYVGNNTSVRKSIIEVLSSYF